MRTPARTGVDSRRNRRVELCPVGWLGRVRGERGAVKVEMSLWNPVVYPLEVRRPAAVRVRWKRRQLLSALNPPQIVRARPHRASPREAGPSARARYVRFSRPRAVPC